MVLIESVISASAEDFRKQVWPLFVDRLGGGSLIPVEGVTDSAFAKLLDTRTGIDAWHVLASGGIRGVAARVQWGPTDWGSWTVRTRSLNGGRTEFDKLLDPDLTLLRPAYHIQAYLAGKGGPVISAACIQTRDLIRLLFGGHHGPEKTNPDGTRWVPVWWDRASEDYEVLYA